jgi:hypothetical protein
MVSAPAGEGEPTLGATVLPRSVARSIPKRRLRFFDAVDAPGNGRSLELTVRITLADYCRLPPL